MAKPTVRVRIAFYDGPYYANPGWTDVTSYVRSIRTSRGRTDDWQHFSTGTASVELDNRDRRYDPTYTAGPYYGYLNPRAQILIDATVDGSTYYDVFRGYVAGWPVRLSAAGYDSTVTLDCFDALGLLSTTELAPDWADTFIQSLAPKHYWKCNEATTSTTIYDYGSVGLNIPVFAGRPTLVSNESIAPGVPYNAANMTLTTYYATQTATSTTGDFTVIFWYRGAIDGVPPISIAGSGSLLFTIVSTYIQVDMEDGLGSAGRVTTSRGGFGATDSHHMAVTYTASTGALRIYVDGVDLTGSQSNLTNCKLYPVTSITMGRGTLAQVQLYNSVISAANIQNIYRLSATQLIETTTARYNRIMAYSSFPASLQDPTSSPTGTVSDITLGKFALVSELQLVSDSEGGDLFVTRGGSLKMTNRTYTTTNTNSATSQGTFGAGGIPIQTEMDYQWSADNMRNTINVTWSGGAVVTATNSSSVSTYGTAAEDYQTQLSTNSDALSLANYLVAFGYLPRLVMSAVEVGQALTTAQWVTVLGLELLERITVVVPEQVGSNLSQTQLVQQITHNITPGDWRTTILGSSRWSSVFTIGTSYIGGTDILG